MQENQLFNHKNNNYNNNNNNDNNNNNNNDNNNNNNNKTKDVRGLDIGVVDVFDDDGVSGETLVMEDRGSWDVGSLQVEVDAISNDGSADTVGGLCVPRVFVRVDNVDDL